MKTFKSFFTIALLALVVLNSCRTEDEELILPPEEQTLDINSNVADLMTRTALNDGSIDNILDNANCFTVSLPVTVFIDGLEIIVDSEEDFQTIEDLFDEDDTDIDELDFQYPITIILSDFTEVVINSDQELASYADQCLDDNVDDEDIECVDFQYPITFSVFDQNNELIDTVTINSDVELFLFIESLDTDDIVNLNFPITLILFDGNAITVNNLDELEDIVEEAIDACDEDDDNDYDDDDCETCTLDELGDVLTNCSFWTVDKLELNDEELDNEYDGFHFVFNEDGTVFVESDTETFDGTWEAEGEGNDITVVINIPGLSDINNIWNLHEIEEDEGEVKIDLRDGDDRLRFECGDDDNDDDDDDNDDDDNDDDNDDSELTTTLLDGEWIVTLFEEDGDNQTAQYEDFVFDFQENNEVIADNGTIVEGIWNAFNNDQEMSLDFGVINDLLEQLNDDDWEVVQIEIDRVELIDVSGGGGGTDILVFEKL